MGYYMNSRGSVFEMDASKANDALEALKNLFRSGFKAGWVDETRVLKADSFEDALGECRFEVELNKEKGVYDDIWFSGEKYSGSEQEILSAFAPFVKKDSYIEMYGEDGELWRWIFDNDWVTERYPIITWDTLD